MPDILIEPDEAFEILLSRFREHRSDLELGLFHTQPESYGGFIQIDPATSRVVSHIDKTSRDFPKAAADNSWAIACWNSRFTKFLHRFIEDKREEYRYSGFGQLRELLFGDVIDEAIAGKEMSVAASLVSPEKGYYLDITEPSKYFQAVLHYHDPSVVKNRQMSQRGSRQTLQVFISHSSHQKANADDLHYMLVKAGYEPKLDTYDIRPGQQIPKRIESLIRDSDFFILLLSSESLASKWVTAEVALAYAAGFLDEERLLPVQIGLVPDEEANSVPLIPKSSHNWLDGTKGLRPVVDWLQGHAVADKKRV